jgi:hypothetical protein
VTSARPDAISLARDAPHADHRARLPRISIAAAIACALAVATLATYLVLLSQQGTPPSNDRVLLIAAAIAILSLVTGVAALVREARTRLMLLGVSTPGLLGVGFIGAWSIGIPLLLAGILAGGAAVPAARASRIGPLRLAASGVLLTGATWAALFVGLVLTDPGRT